MTTKLEFLGEHPIFADLDDDELIALSQIAKECDFNEGSIIAYQRDVADGMVIVKSGRLYAQEVDPQGVVRAANTRQYEAKDYYGTEWLFETGTHPATVTGTHEGRLILINGEEFRHFLMAYPSAIHHLEPVVDEEGHLYSGLPEEAWEKAEQLPLTRRRERIGPIRLLPDELVQYYSRRSTIVLLESLFWPVLGMILIPLTIYFLARNTSMTIQTLGYVVAGLAMLLFGGIFIFRLLDWRNDYFVITNKHISHREFELRSFRTRLNKVPVGEVQSVTVERPTLLSNIFNVGSVKITTASVIGTVRFDGIDNPTEVEYILENLRQRYQSVDAALAQTNMRASVERHFQIDSGVNPISDEDEGLFGTTMRPAMSQRGIGHQLFRWFNWRIEEDGVITYRRNYFILFWEILLPSLVLGLLLLTAGLIYRYIIADWTIILFFLVPAVFVTLFWMLWRYENWHNDMFQLTPFDVIDIDRKPFGCGESRKQAPLHNIQNVTAERPGFFATVFDYGNVHIETAGAGSDIVFDKIPRPSIVLSDIFRRLEENREKKRRKDGEMRREEYAVLLDVYKQELERDRIPRRMPELDE
ncbi:MAG: PH domain-containing protein [Candidatus Promineifilaceae bacterium]|nr:PH domain-containing protein [Candidatus Promineifilaceae bacterium]